MKATKRCRARPKWRLRNKADWRSSCSRPRQASRNHGRGWRSGRCRHHLLHQARENRTGLLGCRCWCLRCNQTTKCCGLQRLIPWTLRRERRQAIRQRLANGLRLIDTGKLFVCSDLRSAWAGTLCNGSGRATRCRLARPIRHRCQSRNLGWRHRHAMLADGRLQPLVIIAIKRRAPDILDAHVANARATQVEKHGRAL